MPHRLVGSKNMHNFAPTKRSGARVAEEARLESVYTPKAYPEFESRSLRIDKLLWMSCLGGLFRVIILCLLWLFKVILGQSQKSVEMLKSGAKFAESEKEEWDVRHTVELRAECFLPWSWKILQKH